MKKNTHKTENVAEAISLFFAVRRIMNSTFARGKKLDPSTWLRIETMKFISCHEKPKMKDIADYLSITAPSTTSLVNGLIESGLVTSKVDARDRRASLLVLTPAGKKELKLAMKKGVERLSGLFSILSEQELSAFSSSLSRIKSKFGK
jgi:DNA-binding MarR family transcriptional regulator